MPRKTSKPHQGLLLPLLGKEKARGASLLLINQLEPWLGKGGTLNYKRNKKLNKPNPAQHIMVEGQGGIGRPFQHGRNNNNYQH
jgi:hypothetical protein